MLYKNKFINILLGKMTYGILRTKCELKIRNIKDHYKILIISIIKRLKKS